MKQQHDDDEQLSLWLEDAIDLFLRLPNASAGLSTALPAPVLELARALELLSNPPPDWTHFSELFERWEARHWAFVSSVAPEQARLSPRLRSLLGTS